MGTNFEFHAADPAVVRKNLDGAKQFVRLSHDIGGTGVKVKPNALPKEVPKEKTLNQIGQALAGWVGMPPISVRRSVSKSMAE
ncbi:MAG: hypothetical protein R3F31_18365 [Verrucomicrobiales bacterium]